MGICPHCMQQKPHTASKCYHCHERIGFFASIGYDLFHEVVTAIWFVGLIWLIGKVFALLAYLGGAKP
jgi:hypothetical protein